MLASMYGGDMYWGDDFDQQQAYVDVYGIHRGLERGSLSFADAMLRLEEIRQAQLRPWLKEDLGALTTAWRQAAATL